MPTDPPSRADAPGPALVRCPHCGRTVPANRGELLTYARSGLPQCCGREVDLYILAERPQPEDKRVVALPVVLPGSGDSTAVIPNPPARKPVG